MNWPEYIFSGKEISDFKRRVEVARKLKAGVTWKNIKKTTGAHLQTIAIISKRLKSIKTESSNNKNRLTAGVGDRRKTVFVFGRSE